MCLINTQGVEISQELTEAQRGVEESVQLLGRVASPLLEQVPQVEPAAVADVVRALEDALSQKQWSHAVQLLRGVRLRVSIPPEASLIHSHVLLAGDRTEMWGCLVAQKMTTSTVSSSFTPNSSQTDRKVYHTLFEPHTAAAGYCLQVFCVSHLIRVSCLKFTVG